MILWKNGIIHLNQTIIKSNVVTDKGLIIGFDCDEEKNYDDVIDLENKHVYAGFIDAHLHLIGYGEALNKIDGTSIKDIDTLIKIVNQNLHKEMLFIDKVDLNLNIKKQDLDSINDDIKIIIRHQDYHSITVNSNVLSTMNLKSETGFLTEDDQQLVMKKFLKTTDNQYEDYLNQAIDRLVSYGITAGHSDDLFYFNGFHATAKIFDEVSKQKRFRCHLLVHHEVLEEYISSKYFNYRDEFLEFGAVKVFYDGTLTSQTAMMNHPYKTGTSGISVTNNFVEIVQKVRALDLNLAIHVIGDKGLDELVEILMNYPPNSGLYDRIIHASFASKAALEKLKDMPVSLDVQPSFIETDLPLAYELLSQNPDYVYPFKTYHHQKLKVSFSSDAPVCDPNPIRGMYQAIYRKGSDGKTHQENERLTPYDVLIKYTKDAQFQSFMTNKGVLEKGYVADFTILEQDILNIEEQSFLSNSVCMTVIDEKIVYKKKDKNPF